MHTSHHHHPSFVFNPSADGSESLVEGLCQGFPGSLRVSDVTDYGKSRNLVVAFDCNQRRYVAKYFATRKLPDLISRWLRLPSKAEKSYRHALRIQESGFLTALPVGYWDNAPGSGRYSGGFLAEHIAGPWVADIHDPNLDMDYRKDLMTDLSFFTLRLHLAGLRPGDYNVGNILYTEDEESAEGERRFWLIDINRFKFGRPPSLPEAMLAFDQLGAEDWMLPYLVWPYVDMRGWDRSEAWHWILRHRRRSALRKILKHPWRAMRGRRHP